MATFARIMGVIALIFSIIYGLSFIHENFFGFVESVCAGLTIMSLLWVLAQICDNTSKEKKF